MKKKLGVVLCFGLLICVWIGQSRRRSSSFLEPAMVVASSAVPKQRQQVGHPTFVSPHASPIRLLDQLVFVVNTPSDTVDVIDAATRKVTKRINVGIDPVSLAVRPDGKEVWVLIMFLIR